MLKFILQKITLIFPYPFPFPFLIIIRIGSTIVADILYPLVKNVINDHLIQKSFKEDDISSKYFLGQINNLNKNFLSDDSLIIKQISELFNLTDNAGLNLLQLIHISQLLQIYLIILIIYNLLLLNIDDVTVEKYLNKILPFKLVQLVIRIVKYSKSINKIILTLLFLLLIISNLYSYYYLNFFIINIEDIIKIYFKN